VILPEMSQEERAALEKSAAAIKSALDRVR